MRVCALKKQFLYVIAKANQGVEIAVYLMFNRCAQFIHYTLAHTHRRLQFLIKDRRVLEFTGLNRMFFFSPFAYTLPTYI